MSGTKCVFSVVLCAVTLMQRLEVSFPADESWGCMELEADGCVASGLTNAERHCIHSLDG